MKRHLQLRRETLAELASADLVAVRGAADGTHITCYTGLTVCSPCDKTPAIIDPPTDRCPTWYCTPPTR